jgi:hypothetical protein
VVNVATQFTPTGFNVNSDFAMYGLRMYNPMFTTYNLATNLVTPPTNKEFIIKPSKWLRMFNLFEWNADDNLSSYRDFKPITIALNNTDDISTVTIDYTGVDATANRLTDGQATTAGRRMIIDSEIMSIISCTVSGNPRTCQVNRAVDGSSKAAHSIGATVKLNWSYMSTWMASEDHAVMLMLDRVPFMPYRANGLQKGIDWFNVELNASASSIQQNRINIYPQDMTAYMKNVVILKKTGTASTSSGGGTITDAGWNALLVQPTANGN